MLRVQRRGSGLDTIHARYGETVFLEDTLRFEGGNKARIAERIMDEKRLPEFEQVEKPVIWTA